MTSDSWIVYSPRLTTEATLSPAPCQSLRLNASSIIRSILLVKGTTKISRERCSPLTTTAGRTFTSERSEKG